MNFEVIRCQDAGTYVNRRDTVFLDLRGKEAYDRAHLPGAYCCPYEEIQDWEERLPAGKLIICYCEHGNLSLMAAKRLSHRGYRVAALLGGLNCLLPKNSIDTTNWNR